MGRHRKRVRQEDISNSCQEKFEHGEEILIKLKRGSNIEVDEELKRKHTVQKEKTKKGLRNTDKNQKRKSKHITHNKKNHKYRERNHEKSNKHKQKDSKPNKSNHAENGKMIVPSVESPSSEACDRTELHNRKLGHYHRQKETQSCTEDIPDDDLDMSLMSKRMLRTSKKNSKHPAKRKRTKHSIGLSKRDHDEELYEKLKMKVESIMVDKFRRVTGTIKNCAEKIRKSYHNQAIDDGKEVMDDVIKIIEKEKNESRVLFDEKISKNQTFIRRCNILESQLTNSVARCKKFASDARCYEKTKREKTALECEFKSVCKQNTALQTELSEVKEKFQGQLTDKVLELDRLKEVRNSLTNKGNEFREEIEKSLETQRVKQDFELDKIRKHHAKKISGLQVQCSELTIANLDMKKRNKDLKNMLKENQIDSPAFIKAGVATPEKGASVVHSEITNKKDIKTPFSGHRQEFHKLQCAKSSSNEISMLKADIASLRVSLESKSTQVSELWKIYNIYVILTGLYITKKELFFECLANNPKAKAEFLFSLICKDNRSSILYEKNSWEADWECPGFLNDCSGQFFECRLAPLFLKNVIKEIFSPCYHSKSLKPCHI